VLGATQTLRAGCSKAELHTHSRGRRTDNI